MTLPVAAAPPHAAGIAPAAREHRFFLASLDPHIGLRLADRDNGLRHPFQVHYLFSTRRVTERQSVRPDASVT